MRWVWPSQSLAPNWLSRAVIAGFVATVVMTFAFFAAYGIALLYGNIDFATRPQAELVSGWFYALTHNRVIDLASKYLYLAWGVHFAVGIIWAILYAYFAEPRLSGPGWQRGISFAVVPWFLSLVVFLPLAGGGVFGLSTGAGPLPTLGNFVLHLAYGLILGIAYEPSRQVTLGEGGMTEVDRRVEVSSLKLASIGLVIGAVVGAGIGLLGVAVPRASETAEVLGLSPWFFLVASGLIGASLGALVGSLAGLNIGPRVEIAGASAPAGGARPAQAPSKEAGTQEIARPLLLRWRGLVLPEQWETFYNEVLSRLVQQGEIKTEVALEAKLPGSMDRNRLEEVRRALQQLGLDDRIGVGE